MKKGPQDLMARREFLARAGQGMCLLALGSLGAGRCSDTYCQSGKDYYLKPAKMWNWSLPATSRVSYSVPPRSPGFRWR